ncbi:auxin-responsive SAUR15-like [Olea europaea subsp. europaea]|uniref:Auxin-responsive SAUR15-like n=1 Tax=Olea europaea subsp. europaea TaxID=158383 RepID=A0A8S0PDV7_OLEEU|nr:auxin-responsive SAUR15-like [Olea europaea subsp. europaea]
MLGKKLGSMKKLAKKVKAIGNTNRQLSQKHEYLLREEEGGVSPTTTTTTPIGTFAVYVGEDRQRFTVPTGYLSHPLFKILLEKAYNEFGFQQRNGLVVPCCVTVFQEVISAVECCNGKFDFGDWVEEFISAT